MTSERYRELFEQEARESIQRLNDCVMALERAPDDEGALRETYRILHTFKSMAATMGYQRSADLCHALESVVDRAMAHTLSLTPALIELLFQSADRLECLIASAEGDGAEHDRFLDEIAHALDGTAAAPAAPVPATPTPEAPPAAATVRINVKRLDGLINLTGELVIVKSRLRAIGATVHAPALQETIDHLERVSENLQREVLHARMLPIGSVFTRFNRTTRDLAREAGKQVEMVIVGQEIELDRAVLDEISEPLLHLLRNAVAYGIESPAVRIQQGKPAAGTIVLSARREADRVVLEIADDGTGIDLATIRTVAVQRGFATAEQVEALSPQELIALLFLPGFSTASAVTEVSGRGVGLNVVKTRVEALRGSLEVKSHLHAGTRFVLRFPPTLAIVEALLVRAADETFAVPMVDVTEVLEVDRAVLDLGNIIVVRGQAVCLVDLARCLRLAPAASRPSRVFVLVSSLLEGAPGFVVDQVVGQQEIVIKPVERPLNGVPGISGATILGDGRVVLILDLHALVRAEDRESSAPAGRVAFSTMPAHRRTA